MKRSNAALLLTLLALCGACASTDSGAPRAPTTTTLADGGAVSRKPNIVRIVTDDQDITSMRVMQKTKKLLGANGVTYANSVVSLSLCCPSRATLLTGQYAHNHQVWDNGGTTGGYLNFRRSENSLAPWLRQAGYQTAHVGKYMNSYGKLQANQVPIGWDFWFNVVDEQEESYPYYGYTISDNGKSTTYGKDDKDYITDVFTERALTDLRRMATSGQPFFLDYWPTAPHSGNGRGRTQHLGPVAAPRYETANAGANAPRTTNWLPAKSEIPAGLQIYGNLYVGATGGAEKFPALLDLSYRQYLNSLLSVDDSVEALVNELRASGQLENTLIIFTSDNGFMWGNHGLAMKWEPYEESLRVPLIISGPSFAKGVTSDQPVANIDIVPTIVEVAGATAARAMDGTSLVTAGTAGAGTAGTGGSAEAGAGASANRAILIESNMFDPAVPLQFVGYNVPRYKGVRGGGYQYTEWADGTLELFDLTKDPGQMKNLAADPRQAANRAELAKALGMLNGCAGANCNVTLGDLTHP